MSDVEKLIRKNYRQQCVELHFTFNPNNPKDRKVLKMFDAFMLSRGIEGKKKEAFRRIVNIVMRSKQ